MSEIFPEEIGGGIARRRGDRDLGILAAPASYWFGWRIRWRTWRSRGSPEPTLAYRTETG